MSPRLALILLTVALGAGSAALFSHRQTVAAELALLRTARDSAVVATENARLTAEVDRIRVQLERARALSARTADPHLVLSLGDGSLTLERGEIVLRATTVTADVPRGVRAIETVEDRAITLAGGIRLVREAADTTPSPPSTIRIPRADFDAIRPNVRPGLMAYFY
jgi:hypothetical protein